jgi:flagellar biogenesis protein FliO
MNLIRKCIFSFLIFLSSLQITFAVEIPQSMKDSMARDIPGMPSLLNLVVSMVVVIGMIYVTGLIYAKLNTINKDKLKKITKANSVDDYNFTILQSMQIGQQRNLYSIQMRDKVLLIGATQNNLSLLKEFDIVNVNVNDSVNQSSSSVSPTKTVKNSDIDELYRKYKN